MIEKKFSEVPPQAFTANGTFGGLVTIADTTILKVKQKVRIFSDTHSPIGDIEVKRVLSSTTLLVGPKSGSMVAYTDLTTLLVADNAKISADEQDRPPISQYDVWRAVFSEEPTVALRNLLVDERGNAWNQSNPLPVDATVTVPPVEVTLDAFIKVPPDNAIAVGTEDGTLTGTKHAQLIDSKGSLQTKGIQVFTKPFKAITRVYPDPSPGVEIYQSRLMDDLGPVQETATITYADGAPKQEFLKVVVV